MPNLASDREAILTRISALRTGAARFSQLLADKSFIGDEWDRAARILASCREERTILNEDLRRIDSHSGKDQP